MTWIIAAPSDMHINNRVGLCPPNMRIHRDADDEGRGIIHKLPQAQKLLWSKWLHDWRFIYDLKQKLDAKLMVIVVGDLIENPTGRYRPTQVVSLKVADAINMAVRALEEPARIADRFVICRGTPAHVGSGADLEEQIYDRINHPNKKMAYIYKPIIQDLELNFAHHGPIPGSRKWTDTNSLIYYVRSIMLDRLSKNKAPFALYHRAHYHRAFHETVKVHRGAGKAYETEAVISPAYCLANEYALVKKIERELVDTDIGMWYYLIKDRKLTVHNDLIIRDEHGYKDIIEETNSAD